MTSSVYRVPARRPARASRPIAQVLLCVGTSLAAVVAASPQRVNRPPTVRAACDPCTVQAGKTTILSADAQDPDGDALTYQWTAPGGTFGSARNRQTPWTAPLAAGAMAITIHVDDGHGATADAVVTVQVSDPRDVALSFEDAHFDLDKATLRADAIASLDAAVVALKANPSVAVEISGHTCDLGTRAHNLALGERRAESVRDYLAAHGISADRLRTISYGEERPKYDNSTEEFRALNRRVELRVQRAQRGSTGSTRFN